MGTFHEKSLSYQLDCLKAEVDYLNASRQHVASPSYVRKHLQQFQWTVRRLLGLEVERADFMMAWRRHAPLPASNQNLAAIDMGSFSKTETRLLIDATATAVYQGKSGVQRAVRELSLRALHAGVGMPVVFHRNGLYPAHEIFSENRRIEIGEGDYLIMLDASWNAVDHFNNVFQAVTAAKAKVIMCLFDIIPILYPATCAADTVSSFNEWFQSVIKCSSGILCNSQATAIEIKALIGERGRASEKDMPIGWFPLGANILSSPGLALMKSFCPASARPFCLTVGTIEPRKGHSTALKAMEMLWAEGVNVDYRIIGRRGWNMDAFLSRVQSHPEYGKRLYWSEDADDEELLDAYRSCRIVLLPSIAEGFGLPLIEGHGYGATMLVSDIAVFKEIAPEGTYFFSCFDPDDLARMIKVILAQAPKPLIKARHEFTWERSLSSLYRLAVEDAYQIKP